jgi:stalled ribosome rescue protein Dom34
MKPKGYRRGYPVAILIGIEEDHATLWQIFSQVAKLHQTIPLNGSQRDQKSLYNFHETIINALRPTFKTGVQSLIITSPPRTSYAQNLQTHITSHHTWLLQGTTKVTIALMSGSADTPAQVSVLTQKPAFKQLMQINIEQETENLLELLEKRLNSDSRLVFFSLQEAESLILNPQLPNKPRPEYLLLTNDFLAGTRQKNRVQHLMQIAQNKQVKTRVISAESSAGIRLTQLGGIVCLAKNS